MDLLSSPKDRPTAEDVAIRATILRCVVSYAATMPTPDALSDAKLWWTPAEVKDFFSESKIERDQIWSTLGANQRYLSPLEKVLSRATPETITDQELANATWRAEALGVILWTLGVVDRILPYDESTGPDFIGHFWKLDDSEFMRNARLRPREEIDAAQITAQSWHWRSRTRQIIEDGTSFPDDPQIREAGFFSYDDVVRKSAPVRESDGMFIAIDEDYPAFGKAYRDLSDDEWSTVRSITVERHFALNWVCGYAPGHRWDETPTET